MRKAAVISRVKISMANNPFRLVGRLDKDSVGLTPEHGPALGGERAARRIQPNFG
jgi:hypothetical protein